jgi:DNA topoisomerase IA
MMELNERVSALEAKLKKLEAYVDHLGKMTDPDRCGEEMSAEKGQTIKPGQKIRINIREALK